MTQHPLMLSICSRSKPIPPAVDAAGRPRSIGRHDRPPFPGPCGSTRHVGADYTKTTPAVLGPPRQAQCASRSRVPGHTPRTSARDRTKQSPSLCAPRTSPKRQSQMHTAIDGRDADAVSSGKVPGLGVQHRLQLLGASVDCGQHRTCYCVRIICRRGRRGPLGKRRPSCLATSRQALVGPVRELGPRLPAIGTYHTDASVLGAPCKTDRGVEHVRRPLVHDAGLRHTRTLQPNAPAKSPQT